MNATGARALPSRTTQREAELRLRGGLLQRFLNGELRSVALLYLPYHLYDVTIRRAGATRRARYAGDALCGALDPYEFDSLPDASVPAEGRNVLPVTLSPEAGAERLRDQLRRMIYRQGFFRAGKLEIAIQPAGEMILVPYWAGFYGRGQEARLRVLDGVRGTLEGAKAREMVLEWLMA